MELSEIIQFLKSDIWKIPEKQFSLLRRFLINAVRVILITLKGLRQNDIHLRASGLTFYSILSIAPVLALGFGIAKGFGFEKALEGLIYEQLQGQEQAAEKVVDFARATLENVRGGLVAGIGLVILFYTVIKILSHIESSFNDIWGIARPRSLGRKITDYFSLILICPVFFFVSSAVAVFLASEVRSATQEVWLLEAVGPVISLGLKLLPYVLLWFLFTFLYIFIPNTRVNFTSALLAGIIAGTIHGIFQQAYIIFQVGVSKYNAVYGSFAALPLFFIWLQISWLIVLLGAEVAFAHQNVNTAKYERETRLVSHSFKRLLSLQITHFLVKQFSSPKAAWDVMELSRALEIPIRLVNQILGELVDAGILSKVSVDGDRDVGYQPARDTDTLTIKYIVDALEKNGVDDIPVGRSQALEKLSDNLKVFSDTLEASPANQRLKDI